MCQHSGFRVVITDIAGMKFSDIVNDRLQITQGKTGAMISIPLDHQLKAVNLQLRVVIERCRQANATDFFLSVGARKNSTDGKLHLDTLTKQFVAARKKSGLVFEKSPPTYPEIRSLSGRLFELERGKEFAMKLLGHKSKKTTQKYLDSRGKEYVNL
ncbi:integrase [Enterobacterales bacterium CwR94]|nr:integrase [Enterobacterales bacterium CwR94]